LTGLYPNNSSWNGAIRSFKRVCAHDHAGNFVEMEFMPKEIEGKQLYNPAKNAREEEMSKKLRAMWKGKYGY
jgi:replication-associated recombination protein RarA